jgi:hypothetical protein
MHLKDDCINFLVDELLRVELLRCSPRIHTLQINYAFISAV